MRDLIALADPREPATRTQIADLIKRTLAETDTLPNVETVRRKVKTGQHLTQEITVEQWLAEFLNRKRKIEETTRRSYEGHIRLYLTPYPGRLRHLHLRLPAGGNSGGGEDRGPAVRRGSPGRAWETYLAAKLKG